MRFHDGAPFTADDVLFTLRRLPVVPNSPSSFSIYTTAIARAEAVDPWTLRVTTKDVYPLLPVDFSLFAIMGRKQSGGTAPEGKTTAELNAGDGVIGTGPYRFVRWVRGEILELVQILTTGLAQNPGSRHLQADQTCWVADKRVPVW